MSCPRRVRSLSVEHLEDRCLLASLASPADIARALDLPAGTSVAFTGDPRAAAFEDRFFFERSLLGFPTGEDADFLLFSAGKALDVNTLPNSSGSQGTDLGPFGVSGDTATIQFALPVQNANLFTFDFIYLSEEYPEFVGSRFNDFFRAFVNGQNIALDEAGHVVDVNNVHFDGSLPTAGTFFDGRTHLLRAQYQIPAGVTTLNVRLEISDVADGIYDSAVLLDNVAVRQRQAVFLDYDGAEIPFKNSFGQSVLYASPPFSAADVGLAVNQTPGLGTAITKNVGDRFRSAGVDILIADSPPGAGTFSTVVIGGDGLALGYNSLLGIAAAIDTDNRVLNDNAAVFTRRFGTLSFEEAVDHIGSTISHEIGHLLGAWHLMGSRAGGPAANNICIMTSSYATSSPGNQKPHEVFCGGERQLLDRDGTQDTVELLRDNLGALQAPGASKLIPSGKTLLDQILGFFDLSLNVPTALYGVTFGVTTVDDVSPVGFHFGQVNPGTVLQLRIPVVSPEQRFFFAASDTRGGSLNVFAPSGTRLLDADGTVRGAFDLVRMLPNGNAELFGSLEAASELESGFGGNRLFLYDDFEDGNFDGEVWNRTGAVAEQGGSLKLWMYRDGQGASGSATTSGRRNAVGVEGDGVQGFRAEVNKHERTVLPGHAEAYVGITDGGSNYIRVHWLNDVNDFIIRLGGVYGSGDGARWDGMAGRLEIRENGDDIEILYNDQVMQTLSNRGIMPNSFVAVSASGSSDIGFDYYIELRELSVYHEATAPTGAIGLNRLVDQAYRHFLRRPPQEAELGQWTSQVRQGLSHEDVLAGIAALDEYFARWGSTPGSFVLGLYRELLARDPTGAEMSSWRAVLESGAPRSDVTHALSHSEEFHTLRSSGHWTSSLYLDVLGRNASFGEWLAWARKVTDGADRGSVASAFIGSVERRSAVIEGLYERYLGRAADAGGLNYWIGIWNATGGPEHVQAGIIGSPEYYATAGGTDAAWVTALYQNILSRAVDQAGLNFWVQYIQNHSKQSVVLGFVTSDEYRLGLIASWYQDYLRRPIEGSGAQYWLQRMRQGFPQEFIQIGILASDEYRNGAVGAPSP